MPALTIEDAIYAQLLIATQNTTSRLAGAHVERFGRWRQKFVICLPDGQTRYLAITENPRGRVPDDPS